MSDRDHAQAMLAKARKEFAALQAMTGGLPFADDIFGFHAQQVVEKTLKAWIASLGKAYPKTHDLMALIHVLDEHAQDVSGLSAFVELNVYAVQYRYEAIDADDQPLDRSDWVTRVGELLDQVSGIVGR